MGTPSGAYEWADRVRTAVRDRMAELKRTQGEVAARAKIDPSTLSTFLNGHHEPHPRTIGAIEVDGLEWRPRTLRKIMDGEAAPDLTRYALNGTPAKLTIEEMIAVVQRSTITPPSTRTQIVDVLESLRATAAKADLGDDTEASMEMIDTAVTDHLGNGGGEATQTG